MAADSAGKRVQLVSGWSDDQYVHLVERDGEELRYRKVPARWSAFFTGMGDRDRADLSRAPQVRAVSLDTHGYTRVDFTNRFERDSVVRKVEEAVKQRRVQSLPGEFEEVRALEADVRPLRRLLSDSPHLEVSPNPHLVWVDLEVDPRRGFEEMRSGKARILVWSLYALVGGKEQLVAEQVLSEDSDDSEREFLGALYAALNDFDVVLSWNGYFFDFPVLENRTNKLRVKNPATGRPPVWNRWCWLDHMEVYKKYNQAHESGEERASVSLQAVATHLLGEGKRDFDAKLAWEAWRAGGARRAELFRYGSHDTSLMPRIEAKTGFVALHLAVCHVTRCFPDTSSLRATEQGDGFLLALGAAQGFRFPTRQFGEEENAPFAGAYVMEPKKLGAMDEVHVCDFSALYPSIMRTWNMSPDTLVLPRDAERVRAPKCKLPSREVHFRTDVRGLIPAALDQLQAARDRYSAEADKHPKGGPEQIYFFRLSSAFKIINNSMYGIVGSPFARFYDPTIAEGVTQTGKWLILHVAATMEATGRLQPIYGDTDSVFAQGSGELFRQVVKSLNEGWPGMVGALGCQKSFVKLAFEKTFARLLLKSAKCYAGKFSLYKNELVGADKKPEVRGLEYKRGDTLRLARQMQWELIKLVLPDALPQPPLPTVEELRQWVGTWRERVLSGELAPADVTLSKGVKDFSEYKLTYTSSKCSNKLGTGKAARSCGYEFPHGRELGPHVRPDCPRCGAARKESSLPVHVRVAKQLQERGEQVTPGTRIEYLVVRGGEEGAAEDKMNAVPAGDSGVMERLDRDYYWDKLVYPPTQRLLEVAYPKESWTDTVAQRRRVSLAVEREANKGKYEDLPLFDGGKQFEPVDLGLAHFNVLATAEGREPWTYPSADPQSVHPGGLEEQVPAPAHPAPRRRRPPLMSLHGAEEQLPLVLQLLVPEDGEAGLSRVEALLEALAAAARAHPGEVPVVVDIHVGGVATARVKTEARMSRSRESVAALQRLTTPGVLQFAP